MKSALLGNLHGFEGPAGPKHLVLVVEFVQEQIALTLDGDGYPHRSLLQPFQQIRERTDGSYSYSTGLIDYTPMRSVMRSLAVQFTIAMF